VNDKTLLTAFRSHLVALGHVRRASQAAPAGKPPMWVEKDPGTPAPGDPLEEGMPQNDPNITTGIRATTVAGDPLESFIHEAIVDVVIRTAPDQVGRAFELEELLLREFHGGPPPSEYGRYDYRLDPAGLNLPVLHSRHAGGGPAGRGPKGGQDRVLKIFIQLRAA